MPVVEPITAAGGVVYRHSQPNGGLDVLLIYRRGVWDLPKGKHEEGETIRECAAREVAEEVGLDALPRLTKQLADTYHEYRQNDRMYGKTTHWFAMQLSGMPENGFRPQQGEGIEQVEWYPLEKARQLVGYENLVAVLDSFGEWYASQRL